MDRRSFLAGTSGAACAAVLSAKAALGAYTPAISAERKPNIILIMTDEHSAGLASAWIGRKYLHTPNIDALIASGTSYSRAYCANPICVPSRTAIFTGRYPTETGVIDNNGLVNAASMPPATPLMGRIFRDQGYETAYFGKWHINPPQDHVRLHGFERMATTLNEDGAAVAGAVEFLNGKPEVPFLLVVSIIDPHSICEWARGEHLPLGDIGDPPPPDQCPPAPRNLAPQAGEPDILALMRKSYHASPQFPVGDFTPDKWRQYLWAYYRLIERADKRIGQVLGALSASGLDDNSIIIFTSDHGDAQGAHGWNQKTVFYEESVRVPFVVSRKGGSAQTSRRLVNTGIDLIPTLCDLAGLHVPAALPGLSVKDADHDPRAYVLAINRMAQGAPVDGRKPTPDGRMVRSQRYKYCAYSEGDRRESLIDLDEDPGEMVNLAGRHRYAKILSEHRAMLADWCAKFGDSFPVPSAS